MKTLRGKLLLIIGLILVAMQTISIAWVWHESQEQIELMVQQELDAGQTDPKVIEDHIQFEIYETIAALFLPAITSILLTLFLVSIAISRLTRPLKLLAQEIETRSPYNLEPLTISQSSYEVATVEQTINHLLGQLESAIQNERLFTADIAHELRTPLAGLRLNLELMQDSTPEVRPLLARIDQMTLSIEQLLQLARIGQKLSHGQGDQIDLISEVIYPAQCEWGDDPTVKHTIAWEVPTKAYANGDSGLLYLLLRNLLENACRYSPEDQPITVRLQQTATATLLEVIDGGSGVPEEQIQSMTESFVRLDRSKRGSGLGLNIVKRIAQAHQGSITIENRKDHSGLRVQLKLPR